MRLIPGDRVRIAQCPAGWLPRGLVGTCATVLRVGVTGAVIETDQLVGSYQRRFVPRDVLWCLERLEERDGRETPLQGDGGVMGSLRGGR